MKRFYTILCCLAVMLGTNVFAQSDNDWRIHPNDAKYKIYGTYQTTFPTDNSVQYELTEVKPVGLSIEDPQYLYLGKKTKVGSVYFTFDKVKSSGNPDYKHIALWTWDEKHQQWFPDLETKAYDGNGFNAKNITIMLVLDCSISLKDDGFINVKNTAKKFIRTMLKASNRGNIHIGITGFSSPEQTMKLPLQPLTDITAEQMINFIDNRLIQGLQTAIWLSYDDAVDKSIEYVNKLDKNNYAGSAIIAFTDGVDNGSTNTAKQIGSFKAYYNYINSQVLNKKIGGLPFLSYTVFQPGPDVDNPNRREETIEQLKTVGRNGYYYAANTSELDVHFGRIARSLLDNWKVLNCYLSPGIEGRVCWTFGKKEAPKPVYVAPTPTPAPAPRQQPQSKRKIFVGLNFGPGIPLAFGSDFCMGVNLKLGVDFAFPISNNFAVGAYTSFGGGIITPFDGVSGMGHFNVGALMLFGDMDKPWLIGISPCAGFITSEYLTTAPLEFRIGRLKKETFYTTFDILTGPNFSEGGWYVEPRVTLGWHFGKPHK